VIPEELVVRGERERVREEQLMAAEHLLAAAKMPPRVVLDGGQAGQDCYRNEEQELRSANHGPMLAGCPTSASRISAERQTLASTGSWRLEALAIGVNLAALQLLP
jgi:acetyl esterase/lipase